MQSQCRLILANADQYVQSQYSPNTAAIQSLYSPIQSSRIQSHNNLTLLRLYWNCIRLYWDWNRLYWECNRLIGTVIDCIWTVLGCTARTVLLLHVLVSIGPYWPGLTCIRTVLAYIYVIHRDCIGTVSPYFFTVSN